MLDITLEIPRLVEFPRDQTSEGIYVTMSHCWGTDQPTMTTKENLQLMKEGVKVENLSPLFRDAIQLCKMVGCHLLWINSLCIVQDDEKDWLEQSQKMADIYSNAYFNIGSTSATNSSHGLFEHRWSLQTGRRVDRPANDLMIPGYSNRPILVRKSYSYGHQYCARQDSQAILRSRQAPLMDRAWILQETLLARRTLHICSSELIWECMTTYTCECKSHPQDEDNYRISSKSIRRPWSLPLKQQFTRIQHETGLPSRDILDFWLLASHVYSTLRLTKSSDRFFAILGIAKVVCKLTNGTYLAGMWADVLPRALLWTGLHRSNPDASRTDDAPTWSWMSRRIEENSTCRMSYGGVLYGGFLKETRMSVRWLGSPGPGWSSLKPMTRDAFAIELEAPTIPLRVSRETTDWKDGDELLVNSIPGDESSALESFSSLLWADCPVMLGDVQNGTMCFVEGFIIGTGESMGTTYVLVLSKDDGVDGNFYKRVGISYFDMVDNPSGYRAVLSAAKVKRVLVI